MIVLAIIGLIGRGVCVEVFNQFKKAKTSTARMGVKADRDAVGAVHVDNSGSCPKGIEELVAQKELDRSDAKDPWGKDLYLPLPGHARTPRAWTSSRAVPTSRTAPPDDIRSWEI